MAVQLPDHLLADRRQADPQRVQSLSGGAAILVHQPQHGCDLRDTRPD
jgi:hypothetical protein